MADQLNRDNTGAEFAMVLSFTGFAIMVWNLGAVFVLAMTAGNLIPRALFTNKWFHKNFDDYPKSRKAVIPGLL